MTPSRSATPTQALDSQSLSSNLDPPNPPSKMSRNFPDSTPTFKEALRADRIEYEDCTACRALGPSSLLLLHSFPPPSSSPSPHLHPNHPSIATKLVLTKSPRQRRLPRPRRIHVHLGALEPEEAGEEDQDERDAVRGCAAARGDYEFGGHVGGRGGVSVV